MSRRLSIALFCMFALGLAAIGLWLQFDASDGLDPLRTALCIDLAFTSPVVFGLLFVWPGHLPRASIGAVFVAGSALAARLLPSAQIGLLPVFEAAAAVVELVAIGTLVVRGPSVRRAFLLRREAGDDFESALATAAEPAIGAPLGRLFAAEIGVLRSAVVGSFRRSAVGGFTHHVNAGWGVLLLLFAKMLLIETALTHFLVAHWLSEPFAWVLTALGLYALLWLVADWNRLRTEPTRIEGGLLRVSVGIRGSAAIPLDAIASIEAPSELPDLVDLSLFGGPTRVIRLNRPIQVVRALGFRTATTAIGLSLDDAEGFESALQGPRREPPRPDGL